MVLCDKQLLIQSLIFGMRQLEVTGAEVHSLTQTQLLEMCCSVFSILAYVGMPVQASMHGPMHGQTLSSYTAYRIPFVPGHVIHMDFLVKSGWCRYLREGL